jgi:dipeptidyl aminopeptidase/acylaminoacyl peptidase
MRDPFTPEDVFRSRIITCLTVSPRGDRAAFVVTDLDAGADVQRSTVWSIDLASSTATPRPLTFGGGERAPCFSPDGEQLAFVATRETKSSQIYALRFDGGEARRLTDHPGGAASPLWSPDGRQLAFFSVVGGERKDSEPRVIRHLGYKSDGVGFIDGTRQLFLFDLETKATKQLTSGGGDASSAAWAPDGKGLVVVRARDGVRDRHRRDLWWIGTGGDRRQLTQELASVAMPCWSPDGHKIAFTGSREEGASIENLWIIELDSPRERLVGNVDLVAASFVSGGTASPLFFDNDHLLFVRGHKGCSEIVRVTHETGKIEALVSGERQVRLATLAVRAERLVFTAGPPAGPTELYVADRGGGAERQVSRLCAWSEDRALPRVQHRRFHLDGTRAPLDAWLWLPPSGPTEKLPLLVEVHGGPHTFVELGFDGHPWRHILAARGWLVLSPNPVGSGSFGQHYADQLRGRWGEADLPEVLGAIRALIDEGLVDGERVAIAGKSYGGFLAAYAVGHSTQFRAAIVAAPVGDLVSHAGTSDSGHYVAPYDQRAELDEAWTRFEQSSPLRAIGRSTTPVLFLQGEEDLRCPLGQSEQLFAQLIRGGGNAELVVYPGGDHHVIESGRPSHRRDYTARFVAWLESKCGGKE